MDEPAVTIRLTEAEADALYFWTQSSECPDYWTTPLEPVGSALARWYREGSPSGWSNDEEREAEERRADAERRTVRARDR